MAPRHQRANRQAASQGRTGADVRDGAPGASEEAARLARHLEQLGEEWADLFADEVANAVNEAK